MRNLRINRVKPRYPQRKLVALDQLLQRRLTLLGQLRNRLFGLTVGLHRFLGSSPTLRFGIDAFAHAGDQFRTFCQLRALDRRELLGILREGTQQFSNPAKLLFNLVCLFAYPLTEDSRKVEAIRIADLVLQLRDEGRNPGWVS